MSLEINDETLACRAVAASEALELDEGIGILTLEVLRDFISDVEKYFKDTK